jgi:hypothetical protein
MTIISTKEIASMSAYWHRKRKWVGIPLYYLPPDAINANGDIIRFKVKYLDEDENGRNERPLKSKSRVDVPVIMSIVPWLFPFKELKQICFRNDIPLKWVTGISPKRSQNKHRRLQRKIEPMAPTELRLLIGALNKINKQTKLIVEILWYLNRSLGKGGGYVTCEELLRLKVQDLEFRKAAPGCIRLIRTGNRTQIVFYVLPEYLWELLCSQIHNHSPYVFSNKHGGPLLLSQIDIHLHRAGKLAGIENPITSLSLRPFFDKKRTQKAVCRAKKAYRNVISPNDLEIVTAQDWERLVVSIPCLLSRHGKKGKYNPRDLLNAMLFYLRTGCPIRELPKAFPPWKAVDSQHRRWKKNGILEEVLHALKEK